MPCDFTDPVIWECWVGAIRRVLPAGPQIVFSSEDYGEELARAAGEGATSAATGGASVPSADALATFARWLREALPSLERRRPGVFGALSVLAVDPVPGEGSVGVRARHGDRELTLWLGDPRVEGPCLVRGRHVSVRVPSGGEPPKHEALRDVERLVAVLEATLARREAADGRGEPRSGAGPPA